ncbi:MAG: mechanosensitive ion channel [Synechococcaceae cyanobacterium RM1_1_27]|nr:mechanosensitive ion channel [Synechococcaceae cyanobacterium SM2_3_2]NJO86028.1 mechanosensitive ion channel [Synechococcaceae cyanobacterium RM1_1_27]
MNFVRNLIIAVWESLPLEEWQAEIPRLATFAFFVFLSLLIGRYTPRIVNRIIRRFSPHRVAELYISLVEPLQDLFRIAGTLILLSLSLVWIQPYQAFFGLIKPLTDLAVICSVAWLTSRLFRQFISVYGIELFQKLGLNMDDLVLVINTIIDVVIAFVALLIFAQSQQFNLVGLLASLGIGGLAVAFAAQKILEQLLSTIVLYLDRPFNPGDYIRLPNSNPDQLGRVESIGLRSTKIRTAAKNTLLIVPNSDLISRVIENVTLAKKVMVMLYLDFSRPLTEQDGALVRQVITDGTNTLFGIDPGSTNISLMDHKNGHTSRARVTFFILGSSQNSIQLRKRLLELANDRISTKLNTYGIYFSIEDPTIYVESPVTI